jgi:hypothetical protein
MWNVRTLGRDYYNNVSGYVVERTCANQHEIAGTFVGNSNNPGSFDLAYARALMCARNAAANTSN